jgi:4-amino-4-deoxy-L-arabinose transferase-like glycosyltransferase
MPPPSPHWRRNLFLALLIATAPLLGFWLYGLFDIDEGYYAAVTAEMNRRGEWITPFYNGQPWFEKPILLYWAAKPSVALFGEMLGPRLPNVLAGIGLLGLIAWFARRRVSETVALRSVAVMGTSLLFVLPFRMMLTDPLMVLSLSGAMLLFWESLVGDRRWRLLAAALLGVSVLAKGPVGGVFFIVVAAFTYWRERDLRPAYRGHWLLGTLIFAAVVALWYLPAYLANPQVFVQQFLIEQNIGRFAGGDEAHKITGIVGWIFYIPVLFLGMLPWSVWLPRAWPWRSRGLAPVDALARYLVRWAVIVFVFFTLSGSKLPHYILPLLPPLALLLGMHLGSRERSAAGSRFPLPFWVPLLAGVLTMLVNYAGMTYYEASGHRELHEMVRYARRHGGNHAMYQMSRRQADLGTGRPELQDTAQPSILFYLNNNALDAESFDDLLSAPKPLWVVTRRGRLGDEEVARAHQLGQELRSVRVGRRFSIYLMQDLAAPERIPATERGEERSP